MNSGENTGTTQPLSSRSTQLFILSIIVVQVLIALLAYPFLPNTVPSHWNGAGQVNAYSPKWIDTFLFPALTLGVYLLLRLLLRTSPKIGSDGQRTNIEIVDRILAGVFLMLLIIQLVVLAQLFHLPIDILFVTSLALSALTLYMGNYLGKLRRNFWAGVRTPWTLANETVWERTHRFTGWLFVVSGLLGIGLSFVPGLSVWGITGLLIIDSVLAAVYSYRTYKRIESRGINPLSPPFDS